MSNERRKYKKNKNKNNKKRKRIKVFKKLLLFAIGVPLAIVHIMNLGYTIRLFFSVGVLIVFVYSTYKVIKHSKKETKESLKALLWTLVTLLFLKGSLFTMLDLPNLYIHNYREAIGYVTDVEDGRTVYTVYLDDLKVDFWFYFRKFNLEEGKKYKIYYLPLSKTGIKHEEIKD